MSSSVMAATTTTESAHVRIQIISQPRYLAVVRAMVEAAGAKMGLEEPACGQVVLATDEAVTNVIRHGYRGQTDRPIWMSISPGQLSGQSAICIVIEDEAREVDLTKIQGRALDEIRPGGLGVHIIRRVMDAVDYSLRPGGVGVRLEMWKKIGQDATTNQGNQTHGR